MSLFQDTEARVLMIYTGGHIGMVRDRKGVLQPVPNILEKRLRRYPQFHDEEYANQKFESSLIPPPFVLPDIQEAKRIVYSIREYDPLLDSGNVTVDDWSTIANDIKNSYDHFDGFVILHGTDTLAYTASALSFMLENLGKCVVLTGCQIPLFDVRSDGRDNVLSSLIIAGIYHIPEVTVFFNHKLFRGSRITKVHSSGLKAFKSPNFQPLATVGVNIEVKYNRIFHPCETQKFTVHTDLNRNIGLVIFYPSITHEIIKASLKLPIEGVVLQTYGAGNLPSNRLDILEEIQAATKRGVLILNITQCAKGSVSADYETGKALLDVGVIPGADMTPEAALAKLSYVLSKEEWSFEEKQQMLQTNLCGELNTLTPGKINCSDLVEAVARTLHTSDNKELHELRSILFPPMLLSAAYLGDTQKLTALQEYGASISGSNADSRTPLHIACCEGKHSVVQYLLRNGADSNVQDRFGQTPLLDAIKSDHHDIIQLLRQSGAHFVMAPHTLGRELCRAASQNDVQRLQSFQLAGVNLGQTDISGRTALHVAVLHNNLKIIRFLLHVPVDRNPKDNLGQTPSDIAEKLKYHNIFELLQNESPPLCGGSKW